MITYNEIASNNRIPGVQVEIDTTGAAQGLGGQPYKTLIVGQRLTGSGSVPANTLTRVTTADQARLFFGAGSMLHSMAKMLFANSQSVDASFIAMDDPGAGVKASASVEVLTPATIAGTAVLYVAGIRIQVGITANQTKESVATAIAAAINAQVGVEVSAEVDGVNLAKVVITALHAGTIGNSLSVKHSHLLGEFLPVGLTMTVVGFAGGTGTPDLTTALSSTGGDQYNVIVVPYTDASLLTELVTELNLRAGPELMNAGMAISATNLAWAQALALGDTLNSGYLSMVSCFGSQTPPWGVAAAVGAQVSASASEHPAQPFQHIELVGVSAPAEGDRFTRQEYNGLLHDGIATLEITKDARVQIQRLITTYQTDATGGEDIALLDMNTPLTLERLRYDIAAHFSKKYPRAMVASDGARVKPGIPIVTPIVARAEVLSLAESWHDQGFIEGLEQFEQDLVVERHTGDPSRMDIRLVPNVMNQLREFAIQLAFKL